MPELTEEQIMLLEEFVKNAVPVTLNISKDKEEKALKECYEYIQNGNKIINDLDPLTVYYIISKLPEDRQISFIKDNISYIKKHENDIFLYTMLSPKSLSYFLSFNVIKQLRVIDIDIFKKVINQNYENLFHGFNHEDYYSFYTEFYDDLVNTKNYDFINGLYYHNRCCYANMNEHDINDVFKRQNIYNKEFMMFLLDKYSDKINTFDYIDLLNFTRYIEDIDMYRSFINVNYDKLNEVFYYISEFELKEYLSDASQEKQEILISNFFENIVKKQDIKKIIFTINPNVIIDLYKKNKETFASLDLNDWIKICSKSRMFNNDFKEILDSFKINNIEELFDTRYYISDWPKESVASLKYVENKYRNNIKINGLLEKIDESTSIFSEIYLKNLSEIRELLKNKKILKSDEIYKQHLYNFILFLKNKKIINDIDGNNFIEIEKLFYKIIKGSSMTILYEVSSIQEITIFNRLGKIDFNVDCFTVEQLEKYNVKLHKQLYKQFQINEWHIGWYKNLILKLFFIIGFNNALALLNIDNSLPVLEHLVGNVSVKNIMLDNQGNPILNTKIMNLLFNDKDYSRIKEMLMNKDNELYKCFPRIFNEWEIIKLHNKDTSLNSILDFLMGSEILLLPKYYRLEGLFKFIGCKDNIVKETLLLHDQTLNRVSSTIPRITGIKDGYEYEVLRLDDMRALSVGNETDCCFTVLGNGYICLKHALTSHNGRILVIKKDNQILAHSWIWRNGDLLCLDNIEISKKISCVDFFDIYLQFADDLIKTSYQNEGINNCIKNVTIGVTNFDKEIKGIETFPCIISKNYNLEYKDFGKRLGKNRKFVDNLPQPIEDVKYSDAKNVQYLIRGTGVFKFGQSNFYYQDDRKEIMSYSNDNHCSEDYINEINKKVNALRYIKSEMENTLNLYKIIDIRFLKEVYCNDDWYIIVNDNGDLETFSNSVDKRADAEINSISIMAEKKLKLKKE